MREMRLLSQERPTLRVIESRTIKLLRKPMTMKDCGDSSLLLVSLQDAS